MDPDTTRINVIPSDQFQPADSPEAFLDQLRGPTAFVLPGRDRSRCRMVITLQHGNEPSGIKALLQLMQQDFQPEVDLVLCLASVETARTAPVFFHRYLPGHRDLNRCFQPPFDDKPGQLAWALLELIDRFQPEAVIDLHNTSGSGPAFGVSVVDSPEHQVLIGYFCQRMILTHMRMGALMEQELSCPVVTVEAGGAKDSAADRIALEGLKRFATVDPLLPAKQAQAIDVLPHPRRLELLPGSQVAYASEALAEHSSATLVLDQAIEEHNFGITPAGHVLGWMPQQNWSQLRLTTPTEGHKLDDYFCLSHGELRTRQPLRLFMVTTRPDIALSDCLFYFVPVREAH